jgi:hypothetical protein
MQSLVNKLEEAVRYQDLNDLADDAAQGLALTGIGIGLIGWIVMLAQTI